MSHDQSVCRSVSSKTSRLRTIPRTEPTERVFSSSYKTLSIRNQWGERRLGVCFGETNPQLRVVLPAEVNRSRILNEPRTTLTEVESVVYNLIDWGLGSAS